MYKEIVTRRGQFTVLVVVALLIIAVMRFTQTAYEENEVEADWVGALGGPLRLGTVEVNTGKIQNAAKIAYWTRSFPYLAGPYMVAGNGILFLNGVVYDASSGKLRHDLSAGGAIISGDQLYAFCGAKELGLYQLDTSKWIRSIYIPWGPYSRIIVAGNSLYLYANNGIISYDRDLTRMQWQFPLGIKEHSLYDHLEYNNGVIMLAARRFIIALDAQSGKELWRKKMQWLVTNIAVVANRVVVRVAGGNEWIGNRWCQSADHLKYGVVCALDTKTGKLLWKQQTTPITNPCEMAATAEQVYVRTNRELMSLRINDGQIIWRRTITGLPESLDVALVLAGNLLYLPGGTDCKYHAFDARSGKEIWFLNTGQTVYSNILCYNGNLYFGARERLLYCRRISFGKFLWQDQALTDDIAIETPSQENPLVPVAEVVRKLGGSAELDAKRQVIQLRYRGHMATLPLKGAVARIDGSSYHLQYPVDARFRLNDRYYAELALLRMLTKLDLAFHPTKS